jgi:hypothetical protein
MNKKSYVKITALFQGNHKEVYYFTNRLYNSIAFFRDLPNCNLIKNSKPLLFNQYDCVHKTRIEMIKDIFFEFCCQLGINETLRSIIYQNVISVYCDSEQEEIIIQEEEERFLYRE